MELWLVDGGVLRLRKDGGSANPSCLRTGVLYLGLQVAGCPFAERAGR